MDYNCFMGVFDRIFRKKEDGLDFDQVAQKELGSNLSEQPDILNTPPPGFEEEKTLFEMPQSASPARFPGAAPPRALTSSEGIESPVSFSRDLELINSKLDTIKALLTSLEQRLGNIERATGGSLPRQQRLW